MPSLFWMHLWIFSVQQILIGSNSRMPSKQDLSIDIQMMFKRIIHITNWWNSSQLYSTANKSFGCIYVFLMHTFFHISQIFPTANLYQRILQWVNIMEVSIEFKPKRLKIQTNWDPMQTLVSNSDLLDIFQPEILYFLIATIYYWYPCFQPILPRASDNYFWLGFTLFVSRLLHFLC